MRNGDLLNSLERFLSAGNIVHRMKDVSAVIATTASIADPDDNVFQNDESPLVFEGLTRDGFWFNCLTWITIRGVVIVLC